MSLKFEPGNVLQVVVLKLLLCVLRNDKATVGVVLLSGGIRKGVEIKDKWLFEDIKK